MTHGKQRAIDIIGSAIISLLAGGAFVLLSGAWSLKEDASDHKNDITVLNAKLDRILDVVCDPMKDKPRACDEPPRKP